MGGGGWEAEGGINHSWAQGLSHCVFSKTQKQPQHTCQAKVVADSSLTPHAALLMHPSGTIWTDMDLQGQKNAAYESRPGFHQPCPSARVWLSRQAIKWISVLAGLCRVLANPVTYDYSHAPD